MARRTEEKKPETGNVEGQNPPEGGAQQNPPSAETQTENVGDILLTDRELDEDAAAEIRIHEKPEEPTVADLTSLDSVGKYKSNRERFDIATIIGGRITHAIETEQSGVEGPLYALVVEVEVSQGPQERFLVLPINRFEAGAKVGHFDIQNIK